MHKKQTEIHLRKVRNKLKKGTNKVNRLEILKEDQVYKASKAN